MKTKKLTKGTIGFVEVPVTTTKVEMMGDNLRVEFVMDDKSTWDYNFGKYKNWTILGNSNSLTEEQIKLLGLDLEQYKSLKQELLICDENPYGVKPDETFNHPDWEWTRAKYNEAQIKVRKFITLYKED